MARIITALLLLFSIACVPKVYIHTEAPDQAETIAEAGKMLGIKLETTDNPQNAIAVEFKSNEGILCGRAIDRAFGAESVRSAIMDGVVECEPKLWTCKDPRFLAHEVAHVLGLNHKTDTLMDPNPRVGAELDDQQRLTVRASAVLMKEVCRGDGEQTEADPAPE